MPQVYVPQLPRRRKTHHGQPVKDSDGRDIWIEMDITVASVFGELREPVFLNTGVPPMSKDNVVRARHAMKDYNPDEDSIVAIGDPCAIALLTGAAAIDHRKFSVLRWDNRVKQYIKLTFDFNH